MPSFKSVSGSVTKHLEKFGVPSDEHYALIRELLNDDIPKDDIFVYSIKLCGNRVDRQGEFFSSDALQWIADNYVGVSGIYDHVWKSGQQHSRIYLTKYVTEDGEKSATSDAYQYVVAYAYTLNDEENRGLVNKIKAGILKEVSIGFNNDDPILVSLPDGREAKRIDSVTDALEWSFVAVPAQADAGVVKSYNPEQEVEQMNITEAVAKLKSFQGFDQNALSSILSVVESADAETVTSLKAKVKSLEDEVGQKGQRVKELEDQIVSSALEHAINDVMSGFEFVSDTASTVARSVAEKGVSMGEDGKAVGVEETKAILKSDYPFLSAPATAGDVGAKSEDNEDEDASTKEEDKEDKESSTKSLDFTKGRKVNTKSVPVNKAHVGIHF